MSQEKLLSELRIVLLGKVSAGKTSVMKTLLGSSLQNTTSEYQPTKNCEREKVTIKGQTVVVVDTPGLCSAERDNDKIVKEIKKSISRADPGPHVFLLVLKLGVYGVEEKRMVTTVKEMFGEDVIKHILVLFTHDGELGETIAEFVRGNDDLSKFVDKCKGGCHLIEKQGTADYNRSQVTELLEKINAMVQENEGKYYKDPVVKKKIALAVSISAVAGAALGGAIGQSAGRAIEAAAGTTPGSEAGTVAGATVGGVVGAAVGAAAGGLIGCLGIVAVEHRQKKCVIL